MQHDDRCNESGAPRSIHRRRLCGGAGRGDRLDLLGDRRPCGAAPAACRPRGARRDAPRGQGGSRMSTAVSEEKPRRRLFVLLALLVFLALAALFFFRLGSGDPSRIPSALIGRPAPETNMAPVPGLLTRDGKPMP